MMDSNFRDYLNLSTSNQIKFLKEGEFINLNRDEKIEFLKFILKPDLSSKTTASALKILRELKYHDKYFFRKFIYHVDSSVSNAARKAMTETIEKKGKKRAKIIKMLEKEKREDKVTLIKSIFKEKKRISENALISLLSYDDIGVRRAVVKEVVLLDRLNEAKLAEAVKNSVWYVRAALVEILGYRRSKHLLDIVDFLIDDKNIDVKLKLINALSMLERNDVKDYLQKLVMDPVTFVRKEAEKALASI